MLRHIVVLALRNLYKRKFYTGIEVLSLMMGMVAFVLITLYLKHELSYDRIFTDYHQLYRINHVEEGTGKRYSGNPSALGYHASREIPGIKDLTRIFYPYRMFSTSVLVESDVDHRFYEDNFIVADSTFFQLFDFSFIEGNSQTALLSPDGVVISHRIAQKYFGKSAALNQVLRLNQEETLHVTGVVSVPENTHLNFDFMRPVVHDPSIGYVWDHTLAFTYVKVEDEAQVADIIPLLYTIVQNNLENHPIEYLTNYRHRLQPLTDVHHEILDWDIISAVPNSQLWLVGSIALVILILAIVNFINLSTARASERIKEVGMSKILGGNLAQLRLQYLGESVLISCIAGVLTFAVSFLCVPAFNSLLSTKISLSDVYSPAYILIFLLFLLAVGLIAGLYPAAVLLRIHPTEIIKRSSGATQQGRVREVLVIAQFTLTAILISTMLLIQKQIRFMQEADLGFDKEQLAVIRVQQPDMESYHRFKTELLRHNGILKVGAASTTPGSETGSTTFRTDEMPFEKPENFAATIQIDPDFLEVMGMELSAGRNFELSAADYGNSFIVNETVVRQFRLQDPLRENFGRHGEPYGRIIGVVKDFHFASLDTRIHLLVMNMDSVQSYRYIFAKLAPGEITSSVDWIKSVWDSQNPGYPLEYFFQDEHFDSLYKRQHQLQKMITGLGVTAMVLACLGLLGLSSFSILKRTKEIGIRKVIGASSTQIVQLLSGNFLKLLMVANLLAIPMAWWIGSEWLDEYAYRTAHSWWIFGISTLLVIFTAMITVSWQAIKAAQTNPADTLRSE